MNKPKLLDLLIAINATGLCHEVFTAGIGENAPLVRERSCVGLEGLGIETGGQRNIGRADGTRDMSTTGSRVKVLVISTSEELRIAQKTKIAIGLLPRRV